MKSFLISSIIVILSSLSSTVVSLLVLSDDSLKSFEKAPSKQQQPIMPMDVPGIVMPGSSGESKKIGTDELSISDVIGKDGFINIFAGFTSKMPCHRQSTESDTSHRRYRINLKTTR